MPAFKPRIPFKTRMGKIVSVPIKKVLPRGVVQKAATKQKKAAPTARTIKGRKLAARFRKRYSFKSTKEISELVRAELKKIEAQKSRGA